MQADGLAPAFRQRGEAGFELLDVLMTAGTVLRAAILVRKGVETFLAILRQRLCRPDLGPAQGVDHGAGYHSLDIRRMKGRRPVTLDCTP